MYAPMGSPQAEALCDLRSDTFTRPDDAMRQAMAIAVVGDDMYGEDPTVRLLEAKVATLLGKESALFFASGTQSNLAAVMAQCGRGDEAIVGSEYHLFRDEAAGASVLGGIALLPVAVEPHGGISEATVTSATRPDDMHYPMTRLLCLENTVSGKSVPVHELDSAMAAARKQGLNVHLDGARLFNAATALGCTVERLSSGADSVSVCLSKGLGTPAGSVLAASQTIIARARRLRKLLGGAMRQVGVLAAAGLHALEHNAPALVEDHCRAEQLASAIRDTAQGSVSHYTNMVFHQPEPERHQAFISHLVTQGVRVGTQRPAIRMVLHRDVDDAALDRALTAIRSFYR